MLLERLLLGNSSDEYLALYGVAGTNFVANDLAIDASSNLFIAGEQGANAGLVMKLTSTGSITWAKAITMTTTVKMQTIAVDGSGNVYAGGLKTNSGTRLVTIKYNSAGTVQFQKISGPSTASDTVTSMRMHIGSDGNIYHLASHLNGTYYATYIITMNSAGTVSWRKRLTNSTNDLYLSDILFDGTNLILAGRTGPNGGTQARVLMSLSAAGTTINWQTKASGSPATTITRYALCRESGGNLMTNGSAYSEVFTSTGSMSLGYLWSTGGLQGRCAVVDGSNNWFVVNEISSNPKTNLAVALSSGLVVNAIVHLTYSSASFFIQGIAFDATYMYFLLAGMTSGGDEVIGVLRLKKTNPTTGTYLGLTIAINGYGKTSSPDTWSAPALTTTTEATADVTTGLTSAAATATLRSLQGL